MISADQRRLFDDLLEQILADLPEHLHAVLEEVPLIVEDRPSPQLLADLDVDPKVTDLCGLHWGIPLTQRSVEQPPTMPDRMMLFREPILRLAEYHSDDRTRRRKATRAELKQQIRITLLHEIGHHFGLNEADLEKLGYG